MNGIIAFALRMRALMVALFALVMIGGSSHAESRAIGGRDRALHHHPYRDWRGYRSIPQCDAHYLSLRTFRCEAAIHL